MGFIYRTKLERGQINLFETFLRFSHFHEIDEISWKFSPRRSCFQREGEKKTLEWPKNILAKQSNVQLRKKVSL